MAWYIDSKEVRESGKPELSHWKAIHTPGQDVPNSGIYRCQNCGKEVTCNKDDPFPPQNKHQHGNDCKGSIKWKLLVKTETD